MHANDRACCCADEKENLDAKGKAPMPAEDIEEEEPAEDDADEDGEDAEMEEGDSDDMQLAWEMLEVARTIYPKDKPLQLAGEGSPCSHACLLQAGDTVEEARSFSVP